MSALEALKRGLMVLLAAGGLAGPVAVIVYTSSRASAEDLDAQKVEHAKLRQAHDDLIIKVEDDRKEVRRRLDRLDSKQDHMIDLLENLPTRRR